MCATNIVRYPWSGEPLRIEEDVTSTKFGIDAARD